jgi:hypothetical protein
MPAPPTPSPLPSGQVRSTRRGGAIRVVETWFDDPPVLDGCDVWFCHQRSAPVSAGGWQYFYTLQVDLTLPLEQLLARMRKNTAREIRQAGERDGLTCGFLPEPTWEQVEGLAAFYDENPHTPGQAPWDRARLRELHGAGLLHVAEARDRDGRVLARHALLGHRRQGIVEAMALTILQAHGDAALTQAVGRANRWLFFQVFRFYQEQGYRIYDFGGWYAGVDDEKRLKINMFKEGFRGRILFGYDCEEPLTWRGRLFLLGRHLKGLLFRPGYRRERLRRRTKAPRLDEATGTVLPGPEKAEG